MKPLSILLLVALLLALATPARADGPVSVTTLVTTDKTVLGQPLVLPKKNPVLIVSIFEIAPGARLARHKHPFSRYAYVLEGGITVEIDGGRRHSYRAGEVIVEAVDTWHFGMNEGSVPARLLVIDQVEAGQSNTIPAK
jgi:quercetin dioxygenase-like cupin family protein